MVAQSVASPVSTAAWHEPNELTLERVDDLHNVATFTAPSKSQPGTTNRVSLDVQTGEVLCSCRAHECGQRCWHVELVESAWLGLAVRQLVAKYSDTQLRQVGEKAGRMCAIYRRRCWKVVPADALAVVAARDEWRRRHPATVADEPAADEPQDAA